MQDFSAILNVKADEVKKPAPLPTGSYLVTIKGFETGESSAKKTPYVRFGLVINEPHDDVDPDQLATYRELGGDLTKAKLHTDYYISEAALYRLTDFLKDVLEIPSDNRSINAMLDEVTGKQCYMKIVHEPSQDGKTTFAKVGDLFKA